MPFQGTPITIKLQLPGGETNLFPLAELRLLSGALFGTSVPLRHISGGLYRPVTFPLMPFNPEVTVAYTVWEDAGHSVPSALYPGIVDLESFALSAARMAPDILALLSETGIDFGSNPISCVAGETVETFIQITEVKSGTPVNLSSKTATAIFKKQDGSLFIKSPLIIVSQEGGLLQLLLSQIETAALKIAELQDWELQLDSDSIRQIYQFKKGISVYARLS